MGIFERVRHPDEQSLMPLVELSTRLKLVDGQIHCFEPLKVPLDDHGIPRRVPFLRQVLGTVATDHYWTGFHDVHHLAWPGADYQAARSEDEVMYRGAAALKIRLPRQLHNYIHKISLPPPKPSKEIMMQVAHEQGQVARLYDTVKVTSTFKEVADHETREQWRYSSYMEKLQEMTSGELGIMPEVNHLSSLQLDDARAVLRALARTRGLSNARRSQGWLYGLSAVESTSAPVEAYAPVARDPSFSES